MFTPSIAPAEPTYVQTPLLPVRYAVHTNSAYSHRECIHAPVRRLPVHICHALQASLYLKPYIQRGLSYGERRVCVHSPTSALSGTPASVSSVGAQSTCTHTHTSM